MQYKKFISLGIGLILLVGTAAFVAGKMRNNKFAAIGLLAFGGMRLVMESSINLIPAKELPAGPPQGIGLFMDRTDNMIVLQSTSLKTGGQGIVVHKNEGGPCSPAANMVYSSNVEVGTTMETGIYRETTPPIEPSTDKNLTIQQTVENATLDELTEQSYVGVWGRKSGDRIIAEITLINTPVIYKRP